jgi:hypothetical protein
VAQELVCASLAKSTDCRARDYCRWANKTCETTDTVFLEAFLGYVCGGSSAQVRCAQRDG